MKRILTALVVFLVAYTLFGTEPNQYSTIRVIGHSGQSVYIDKFQDGPNTCYVANGWGYSNEVVSISCLPTK